MDADWLSLGEKLAISGVGWAARKGYQYFRQHRSKFNTGKPANFIPAMAYGGRRRYRRRRYRRRYPLRRRFKRRYRKRSGRRGVITRTASQVVQFDVGSAESNRNYPINMSGVSLINGLGDYVQAFTEVRIVRMTLTLTSGPAQEGVTAPIEVRYVVAPSKPWAKAMAYSYDETEAGTTNFIRDKMGINLAQIQQLRGCRYKLPSTVGTSVRLSFVPYRMSWQLDTLNQTPAVQGIRMLGRPVSAARWMPISWLVSKGQGRTDPVFLGPYCCPINDDSSQSVLNGILKVTYQIRGQV